MALEYTPTQAINWTQDVWTPEINIAAYEEMRIEPTFLRLGKVGERVHVRKHANLARQTAADGTALINLTTYSGAVEAEVTGTPTTIYIITVTNQNTIARMMQDPRDTFRRSIDMSIAEGVDVACALKIDDLVNIVGGVGQNVTEATFLDGMVVLAENAKGEFTPGKTKAVFVFHTRQLDDVIDSTKGWNQYQIRGDQDNAISNGMINSAYGFDFIESGNIQNVGALFHNGMYIPQKTFGIGYNMPITPSIEQRDFAWLVKGIVDFSAVTIWDVYGADYNTQTVA